MTIKELMDKQSDSPAEAEESQVEAQQSGHHMSDKGTGLTGVEVEPKPHSHQQGKQLTCHKVNLHRGTHRKSSIQTYEIRTHPKRPIAEAGPGSEIGVILRQINK